MGFNLLHIIDILAHLIKPSTRLVARGAGDILDNITCFSSLAGALVNVDFTVATTARL
ncbi:MAG: hypothetical protein ACSLEM_02110 [Candidatus Malihini olakiniferum]